MKILKFEHVGRAEYILRVEVDPETFDKAVNMVFKKRYKEYDFGAGCRPGSSTHRNLIYKVHGKDVFYEEALKYIDQYALEWAMKELDREVLHEKHDFQNLSVSAEEGAVVEVMLHILPQVKLGKYKNIELSFSRRAVSDEEVIKELETVRWGSHNVEGPAREGDTVSFTLLSLQRDGEELDFNDANRESPIHLMPPGIVNVEKRDFFIEQLAPEKAPYQSDNWNQRLMQVGRDFTELCHRMNVPDPHAQEILLGRSQGEVFEIIRTARDVRYRYKIEINAVNRRFIWELNDEFARHQGYESLEEILAQARENLELMDGIELQDKLDDYFNDFVEGDIPQGYIDRILENEYEKQVSELAKNDLYVSAAALKGVEEVKSSCMQSAIREIKHALVLDKIAEAEGFEVTEEELLEQTKAEFDLSSDESARNMWEDEDVARFLTTAVLRNKAKALLNDNVSISLI